MDGLSAAASGIAVASLAIQLVDSVREIGRFFRTLKDAPEEWTRLLDLLEHMELMLDNIGKLVEPDSDISTSVLKAIQTCEKALNKLDALIKKIKRDSSPQSALKKSLGFFKLACKKEEIEEIERQLDRAVSILNMVMTALNLHGIQWLRNGVLATNTTVATITEVVLRMEVAANQNDSKKQLTGGNCNRTSRPAVRRRSQNHKIVYRGFLGSITAIVQSESEDLVARERSKDTYPREEWSWVFIPSFLSRCVQVKYASFLGSVERTLRTYPVLPIDHRVWDMCIKGDVTSIQELFRTREISPYAMTTHGSTLLHYATWNLRPEMCGLLIDMGVRTDIVDTYGATASGMVLFPGAVCDRVESTYRLFTAANDDRDLAKFCPGYFRGLEHISIESFRSRVEEWVREENVNLFRPIPLEIVASRLCNLSIDPTEYHMLKEIASCLIAKGAKFHELKFGREKHCLLMAVVALTSHPLDSQIVGTRLLEILAVSNVDVAGYLAFERQHHPEGLAAPLGYYGRWPYSPDPRAVKLEINEKHPFSLSWDWWVDPKEPAFTVIQEFRHFGRAEMFLNAQLEPAEWSVYWPFIYPYWTRGLTFCSIDEGKALLERIQQRSDHRWKKKMIKQAKIQGTYKKFKMPGSWIH